MQKVANAGEKEEKERTRLCPGEAGEGRARRALFQHHSELSMSLCLTLFFVATVDEFLKVSGGAKLSPIMHFR